MYTSGDDDWSDLGLQRGQSKDEYEEEVPVPEKSQKKKQRQSLPTNLSKIEDKEEVKLELEESTDLIRSLSKNPQGGLDGYGEGVPVLNRKISAPVLPYGSPRAASEEKEPPPVRRKSSELSSSMKSRLEAFTSGKVDEEDKSKRVVESDNTFRQKLQNFRKISEPQPEPEQPPGPKPKLSYKNLIGNNFSESNARTNDNPDHDQEDQDLDDVDQLLDDALEESYRAIEDHNSGPPSSNLGPPTEKPPPPPTEEEHAKNQRNLELTVQDHQDLDKQEQEIIASLELEEREHKKYMDRRTSGALSPNGEIKSNPSPTLRNISPALSSDSKKKSEPQQQAGRSSYNQHWLVQEAEQRRISEQQMRHQQQQSPVYENSNYVGGGIQPQVPSVPPPSQVNIYIYFWREKSSSKIHFFLFSTLIIRGHHPHPLQMQLVMVYLNNNLLPPMRTCMQILVNILPCLQITKGKYNLRILPGFPTSFGPEFCSLKRNFVNVLAK